MTDHATSTTRKTFVNLPVTDLEDTVTFFRELGFDFDERFGDETAACMVVSDASYVMLLERERFTEFITREICDAATEMEAIIAVTAPDRRTVDDLVDRALAAGGTPAKEPEDHGFMYGRSFLDLDGHHWEIFTMDESAFAG